MTCQILLRTPWDKTLVLCVSERDSLQQFLTLSSDSIRRQLQEAEKSDYASSEQVVRVSSATGDSPQLRFSVAGHSLSRNPLNATLESLGIKPFSVVDSFLCVKGGGGDGGATGAESRDCYLQMYAGKKAAKVDRRDTQLATWTRCELSGDPLSPPCVADLLGNVFNKEAIVRALVMKSMPSSLSHIRGLKDVIDLKFDEIPGVDADRAVRFQCPITGLEFNGNFKFVALRGCGHVVSSKALRELHSDASCPVCYAAAPSRVILHGDEEERLAAQKALEEELAKRAAAKKKGSKGQQTQQAAINSSTAAEEANGDAKRDASNAELAVTGTEANKTAAGAAAKTDVPTEVDRSTIQPKKGMVGAHLARAKEGQAKKQISDIGKAEAETAKNAEGKGVKREREEHDQGGKKETQRPKGSDRVERKHTWKASDHVPEGATASVYKSIFTSSAAPQEKETYSCRALPLGRF